MRERDYDLFKKFNFPILTNLRFKKIKKKYNTGKITLQFIKKNNFYYNSSFNEKKIKYNKNYNNDQNHSSEFRNHLDVVLKILLKYFKKTHSVIEIGCGKGFFFQLLQKNFNFIRGFDTTYEGKNKKIEKRYLNKNDLIKEDLIILRHTLEHIPDHYKFLKFMKKISTNNPYILIEVPDFNWIKKKQTFFDITYEHCNYFTKETFIKLFNNKLIIKNVFKGQYLLILAKINDLNLNYEKNINQKITPFNKIFPKFKNKFNKIKLVKNNIFVWGAGTKGLMFLTYLKYLFPHLMSKIMYIVDIDKKKTNHYLQIVDKLIISPNLMLKKIKLNDTILISNSNYFKEIKEYIDRNFFKNKIKYLTID